jgi:IS30 family transposase
MSGYVPELAQNLAVKRHADTSKRPRLKSQEVRDFVHEKLNIGWTPEQISGTINETLPDFSISYEAIYQYIYTDYREGISLLARSHKQRYPRKYSKKSRAPKIKNRVDIDKPIDAGLSLLSFSRSF